MMVNNDIFDQLLKDYGLSLILEQNDIDEAHVLHLLYMSGQIDLEDYIFPVLEDLEDED